MDLTPAFKLGQSVTVFAASLQLCCTGTSSLPLQTQKGDDVVSTLKTLSERPEGELLEPVDLRTEPPPRLLENTLLGPILIGWREWVGLPTLGVAAVRAKADTGARTGALHAEAMERFSSNGTPMIRFRIFPFRGDRVTVVPAEAELIGERLVRSSDGGVQTRPVIRTVLAIAGMERTIELTLARRDLMGFRLLLGRAALDGMLVDPQRSYLWGEFTPPLPFRASVLPPPPSESNE
jgi:hypothetical protein